MSAMSSNREDQELQAVLEPFINVLRSPGPITIPTETVQGALTHFIGSLQDSQLDTFVDDILSSTSLWETVKPDVVRECVRSAVPTKVASLRKTSKDTFWRRNVLDKDAQAWLAQVQHDVHNVKGAEEKGQVFLTGLLQGLDDVTGVEWGKPRVDLEEELVIAMSDTFDAKSTDAVKLFCEVAPHVDAARLRALNLREIMPFLHVALFSALGFALDKSSLEIYPSVVDAPKVASLSHGLSVAISALLEGGPTSQQYAWQAARAFTFRMYEVVQDMEKRYPNLTKNSAEWERRKSSLLSLLAVSWPVVQLMLDPAQSLLSEKLLLTHSELLILILSHFAVITEDNDSGLEQYEKVLYGSLDIIVGLGGGKGVSDTFRAVRGKGPLSKVSESLATFILTVAEQLIHLVDARAVRDTILPLAEQYMVRPQHKASFEASFAFLLVLVDAASETALSEPSQGPFVDALVHILAHGLIKQTRDGSISPDQLKAAYPTVVKAASRRSPVLVATAIKQIEDANFEADEAKDAVRIIRIGLIPYIPGPDMPEYLENIAQLILSTKQGTDARLEAASTAFQVIMKDIPDESRQYGIEWWQRWRRRFNGSGTDAEAVAKL
ncbi:hypothetical protein Q8F55_000718 [Vanrija albida]|uniref:Uncharacterized protein n=1 Tax=Vanrija albida TaxID=181172 RepID=A0ABR3QE25_9TREE